MYRRRRLLVVAALLSIPLLMLSGCKAGKSPPQSGAPSSSPILETGKGVRLSLTLGPAVTLAETQVQASGGTITVERSGDPLDGLTIDVPQDTYAGPVAFDLSYRPVTEAAGLGDTTVLSPLIEIDNGGAVAQDGVALTIPVTVYEGQFPMAFYYDEATGRLEGLATLGYDKASITVTAQHFSTIIVTGQTLSFLEDVSVDTGFRPGVDTWQFQNQGAYVSPRGICWGMSVSSLHYYLNEKAVTGLPLWGQFDAAGGVARTADYWPDDDWGLMVASAVQRDYDVIGPGSQYNIRRVLARAYRGQDYEAQLNDDEIAYYSLVTALVATGEPQLVNIATADGRKGHSLIAYRLDGPTIYVADPNDYQQNPPARTITFANGKLSPYRGAENVLGDATEYADIDYYGQSALSNWSQVASVWSQGFQQTGYPEYHLMVEERDAAGNETQTYELDPLTPLRLWQEELSLRLVPEGDLQARVTLMHYELRDIPVVDGPLPLRVGENTVGVYVEGMAHWKDAQGQDQSGWRWLGFDWITVNREDATPTPPATSTVEAEPTATATPTLTPTATPMARSFVDSVCECPALEVPGITPVWWANRDALRCEYGPTQSASDLRVLYTATYLADPQQAAENLTIELGRTTGNWCDGQAVCTSEYGLTSNTIENTDVRFTRVVHGSAEVTLWQGRRGLLYRDNYVITMSANLQGASSEANILAVLDKAEECAIAAVDRSLGE